MIRVAASAVIATILSMVFTLALEWWIGRRLLAWEMAVAFVGVLLALVLWEVNLLRKRQARDRLQGMRDSALW